MAHEVRHILNAIARVNQHGGVFALQQRHADAHAVHNMPHSRHHRVNRKGHFRLILSILPPEKNGVFCTIRRTVVFFLSPSQLFAKFLPLFWFWVVQVGEICYTFSKIRYRRYPVYGKSMAFVASVFTG